MFGKIQQFNREKNGSQMYILVLLYYSIILAAIVVLIEFALTLRWYILNILLIMYACVL